MARNGAGVYSLPGGSIVVNGDTSDASDVNTPFLDIAADLNTARPIVAGGTGATSAAAALVNLGITSTAAELNALDGKTDGTFADFTPPFGLSPNTTLGGDFIGYSRTLDAADTGIKPGIGLSFELDGAVHSIGERFFAPGLYVQGRIDGGTGAENTFFASVIGYSVNNMNGDGDAVGVAGRARKTDQAGNIGDAAGGYFSAYQNSVLAGGVMGGECVIFRNVAGRTAADGYNGGNWETAIHIQSDSTGAPALSGALIGSTGETSGKYGYWNGINFDRSAWAHNGAGAGIAGTVGINMASADATFYPQTGIKFGNATWHLSRPGFAIIANTTRLETQSTGTATGFRATAPAGFNAYLDFYTGTTSRMNFFYSDSAGINILNNVGVNFSLRRDSNEVLNVLANGDIQLLNVRTTAPATSKTLWKNGDFIQITA